MSELQFVTKPCKTHKRKICKGTLPAHLFFQHSPNSAIYSPDSVLCRVPSSSALFQLRPLPTHPFFSHFFTSAPTQPSTNSALPFPNSALCSLNSALAQRSPFPTQPCSNSALLEMRWGGLQDGGFGGRRPPLRGRLCKK